MLHKEQLFKIDNSKRLGAMRIDWYWFQLGIPIIMFMYIWNKYLSKFRIKGNIIDIIIE